MTKSYLSSHGDIATVLRTLFHSPELWATPPPKQKAGLPMLSAISINNNRIDSSQGRLIDEAAFAEEDRRTSISPGDVLLTIVGAIGRTAIVPDQASFHITAERCGYHGSFGVLKVSHVSV